MNNIRKCQQCTFLKNTSRGFICNSPSMAAKAEFSYRGFYAADNCGHFVMKKDKKAG